MIKNLIYVSNPVGFNEKNIKNILKTSIINNIRNRRIMLEQALAEINSLSEFKASSLFDDNDDIASIEYFQNRSITEDFEYFSMESQ